MALYQAPDYSFIGQAGRQFAAGVQALPAAIDAQQKRKLLKDQLAQLKVDVAKVNQVRTQRINEAVQEYKDATGETNDIKATAFVAKYYLPLTGDERNDPSKAIIRLNSADDKFYPKINELKVLRESQETANVAQNVVAGRQMAGAPTEIPMQTPTPMGEQPVPSEPITEQAITQEPAATTRQQAYARYGEEMAAERAPIRTEKELTQQPAIAALPETEKPLTEYQKMMLKLKEDANKIARVRAARGSSDDYNKNLRWAQDRQDEIAADELKYTEKVTKLRQAKVKMMAGQKLSSIQAQIIAEEGFDPVTVSTDEISSAIEKYSSLLNEVEVNKESADTLLKELAENKNLSKAITAGRETREKGIKNIPVNEAMKFIRENVSGKISTTNGSTRQLIDMLPDNLKGTISTKVNNLKAKGVPDNNILKMLLSGQ